MLPFGAQGANMAVENGAALGLLLKRSGENDFANSLAKFEKLRKNRVARVQILSSVRAGRETEVQEKLTKYLGSDVTEPPTTNSARCIHDWGFVSRLPFLEY
ncbi:hypothetical protein BJ170DRAFT_6948 [Xylariales sp. AK1849]|nr:hypothetical protein BJ170DRAFT_6948 [Xylariales sp. AK1849]